VTTKRRLLLAVEFDMKSDCLAMRMKDYVTMNFEKADGSASLKMDYSI